MQTDILTTRSISEHDGENSLFWFKGKYGDFDTPNVITGNGTHHYFKYRRDIRNSNGGIAPGLDIKNNGGYVVGSGSRHLSGAIYQWEASSEFSRAALAEYKGENPDEKNYLQETDTAVFADVSHYSSGTRNVMMTALAGALRNKNEDEDDILAALVRSNVKKCRPPLDFNELEVIAKSVSRYEPGSAPVWVRPTLSNAVAGDSQGRFPVVWLDDAQISVNTDYFVKGLLERGCSTMVYGPSGDGKTFFTIDMLCRVAAGQKWRDKRVKQALVVYVASEAGTSIIRRFVAWRDKNLSEARSVATPFAVITRGPNLMHGDDVIALEVEIRAIASRIDMPIGLIAFDTLSRSSAGADENSAKDMSTIIGAGDYLRDSLGAAVLYVHHSGKDPTKGARGSSALFAACDTVICVEDKTATIEKSRDGATGEQYGFELDRVVLGVDIDDDEISTCVIKESTADKKPRSRPLGATEKIVFDTLKKAISTSKDVLPGTSVLPAGYRYVIHETILSRVELELPDSDNKHKKFIINRALTSLKAAGYIGFSGGFYWVW